MNLSKKFFSFTTSSLPDVSKNCFFRNRLNQIFHVNSNQSTRQRDIDDLLSGSFRDVSIKDFLLLLRYSLKKPDVTLSKWIDEISTFIYECNFKLQANQIVELLCGLKCMSLPHGETNNFPSNNTLIPLKKIESIHESRLCKLIHVYNHKIREQPDIVLKLNHSQVASIFYNFSRLNDS